MTDEQFLQKHKAHGMKVTLYVKDKKAPPNTLQCKGCKISRKIK